MDDREGAETLLAKAEECRRTNEDRYRETLVKIFGIEVYDIPRVYLQLARLKFRSYVTTNFDPMLRTALRSIPDKCDGVYTYPDLPVQGIRRGRLFHIHGLVAPDVAPDLNRIVFGKADIERAYSDEGGTLRSFLVQLFTYNSCCFIGIGLREPELRRLFLVCVAVRRVLRGARQDLTPPQHYALLPKVYRKTEGLGGAQERDLEAEVGETGTFGELGINVIRYEQVDDRHLGLIQLLDECLGLPTVPIRHGFEPESIT